MRKALPAFGFVLVAICLALSSNCVLAAPNVASSLGVIVDSRGAQISQATAKNGSSLYSGDTLSTDADGALRVRFGSSVVLLGPSSVLKIAQGTGGIGAVLQHGVVRFAVADSRLEFHTLAAIIRPEQGASGEMVIAGPSEFKIASIKGNLNVDIDGVDKVVSESTAYDVTLEPMPADPQTVGGGKVRGLWILISLIALLTALGLYEATLSKSKF